MASGRRDCTCCAGLAQAESEAFAAEGLSIEPAGVAQEVVIAASVPLTAGESWRALADGEIVVVRGGRIVQPGERHHE